MKNTIHEESKRGSILSVALIVTTVLLMTPLLYSPVSAVALPPPPPGWNFRAAGGWDKTVDLAPLARHYINHVKTLGFDLPEISQDIHAWIYTVYINQSNTQTFYAGFINFTSSVTNFTMPEQLLIHHFTTRNGNDAIFAASFTMLAVINQTDEIYGSFTLEKQNVLDELRAGGATVPPSTSTKASVLPFSHSSDNNTWSWGMKYENLTTIWWRMFFSNGSYINSPFAVILFDELTFKYNLTIVPATSENPMGSITTRADYVIGNVSHLWHVKSDPNSVEYMSGQSLHDFLANMKISILQHQKTSVYGKPVSVTSDGTTVRNASADISGSGINGTVGDESVSSTDFGRKRNYTLYSTSAGTVWPTTTKTYPFRGLVDNSVFNDTNGIYAELHRIASFVPQFFDPKGRGFEVTMADTDAVFMISYAHWGGYRIVHDPYFAVYTSTPGQGGALGGASGALMILIVGAALIVATSIAVIYMKARKRGT